jgi:HD-like signal output (HDOD) protein
MTVEKHERAGSQPASEREKQTILCKVPVFRPVAIKLLQLLGGEEPCILAVSKLLSSDPGFSAEILTMANSAGCGSRNQVYTIERAVMILGLERTRSLATRVAVNGIVHAAGPNALIDNCWMHSRATSLIAEWLAPFYRIHPDRACTAALMHDIGRLGLLVADPKQYAALLTKTTGSNESMLLAERVALKVDHCEAGLWLTKTWGLPEEFSMVCSEHHMEQGRTSEPLSDLVRLACALAQTFGYKAAQMIKSAPLDELLIEIPTLSRHSSVDVSVLSGRLEKELPAGTCATVN